MSVSGFVNYEDCITQIAPVEPGQVLGMPLFAWESKTIEKFAILHCLPGDLASDLYVYEASNNEDLLEYPIFDLLHERW